MEHEPGTAGGPAPDARHADSAKRRRTRSALVEAARGVFSEHGLGGATIERLTQAAGFTRGAFYSNFDSKEALMLAVMDRERELATARMAQYIEQAGAVDDDDPFTIDELTETLVEVLTVGTSDRDWQLAIMEALPVSLRDPALAQRQVEIRARAEADARLLVVRGLDRLDRRSTVDVDLLVLLLLGLVERILTDALLQRSLETYPRRAGTAAATLMLSLSRPAEGESDPD